MEIIFPASLGYEESVDMLSFKIGPQIKPKSCHRRTHKLVYYIDIIKINRLSSWRKMKISWREIGVWADRQFWLVLARRHNRVEDLMAIVGNNY